MQNICEVKEQYSKLMNLFSQYEFVFLVKFYMMDLYVQMQAGCSYNLPLNSLIAKLLW